MATINTGLGGPRGVGEGSFRGTTLTTGNYDDGAIRVDITSVFGPQGINWFGTDYTSMFINTNGLITFASAQTSYTPSDISSLNFPAVAVFWSDVDIRSGSATGTNNIYWDLDTVNDRVTVTWLGVRPYTGSGTNTFQVVFQHTQDGNFEIEFIYQQVQWTNGYTGVAQTGLTDGAGNDYPLPGSGNAGSLTQYPNASLQSGDPNGTWSTYYRNGQPVCFVAGTQIATPDGSRTVETLRDGDLVLTEDDGPQPVRWTGGWAMMPDPDARPIRFAPGVLGNGEALLVSPLHGVQISGAACELLFGEAEVLVAARDLLGMPGVSVAPGQGAIRYHHVLLDRHQILFANGAAAESLHLGPFAIDGLPRRQVQAIQASVDPLSIARMMRQPAARRMLKSFEARVLVARQMGQRVKLAA